MLATSSRIYTLKDYLKQKYGRRVQKITVALPFTCPNIDGTKATGGCTYCLTGTRPAHISPLMDLREQISTGIAQAKRRYGDNIYFYIYYQSYSNTYGDLEFLKSVYDVALEFENVVGIDIGTRPDCVPENVLELIQTYTDKLDVWVEYGLQSSHFSTLRWINRAHGASDFVDAVLRTRNYKGINICAHLIVGFPQEDLEDNLETAKLIAALNVDGVKIHPLHIIKNTRMAKDYLENPFRLLTLEEYAYRAARIIEILPQTMVIHRLTGEVEPDRLIAPDYCTFTRKLEVREKIEQELEKMDSYQGKVCPFNR
ncbi:MAG: TIGR01212 family radical SAM protein [Hydrogenobaculum sp.]